MSVALQVFIIISDLKISHLRQPCLLNKKIEQVMADFKHLGNHLPHCKERNGRDYTPFLSQKTLTKKAKSNSWKMFCPTCHKRFARLDTHLRNNAMCKAIPPTPCADPDAAPTQRVGGDAIFSTAADSKHIYK